MVADPSFSISSPVFCVMSASGEEGRFSDLDKIMMPDALTTVFGFTATYPGTRPGAAKGGATAAK